MFSFLIAPVFGPLLDLLEEYFSLLFNNSEAVSLLALSVGGDSQAQQAVIDSLETNSEVRGSRSCQAED